MKTKTYLLFISFLPLTGAAQFSLTGQLRTRAEFRDGQGAPLPKEADPAFFISQRTRLRAEYELHRITLNVTIQDVRVWGQDASTINRTTIQDNNGILLHEAWGEISLTDTTNKKCNLRLKIGRQELVYDDQRLLGNLDWLQQGRRHDAALLKFTQGKYQAHLGAAFNQNRESTRETAYNPTPQGNNAANTNEGAHYKSMQFLHLSRKSASGYLSLLLFADQFSRYHFESGQKVWDTGTWKRYTMGLYHTSKIKNLSTTAAVYYQRGTNAGGRKLQAMLATFQAGYQAVAGVSVGGGYDFTSGGGNAGFSRAFDPLYGTPHKFWGLMDYFYAAGGFGNRGLHDLYLKLKTRLTSRLTVSTDLHRFTSASKIQDDSGKTLSRSFGTELDLLGSYDLTPNLAFEAGYGHFFATSTLASAPVKNIANSRNHGNWAYLMANIRF